MADTYEAFYNGKPLNPNRGLPTMTYAQAEDCGLTESERLWCRTDGEDTPVTADDIPYSTGVSVKDKIDDMGTVKRVRGKNDLGGDVTTDGYIYSYIPRVSKDANVTPIANSMTREEYVNNCPNTPTNAFYIIETLCGNDTNFAVQLAYGVSTQLAYYRQRSNGVWQSWLKLTP